MSRIRIFIVGIVIMMLLSVPLSVSAQNPTNRLTDNYDVQTGITQPTTIWSVPVGGTQISINAVATDLNGNAYVAGNNLASGILHGFVAKVDNTGAVQWTYTFAVNHVVLLGIALDQNADVYVAGHIIPFAGNPGRIFYAKLSNAGSWQWQESYTIPSTQGADIAVDGQGNIYITGLISTPDGYGDALITKISPTSHQMVWQTSLGGSYYEYGFGIALDASGNIFATGLDVGSNNSREAFVARLNPSGNVDWYRTFGNATADDVGEEITVADENVYVAGDSEGSWGTPVRDFQGPADVFVVKLDNANGTVDWNTFLGGTEWDNSSGIAWDDDHLIVSGGSDAIWGDPISNTGNSFLARLDGSGVLQWNTFLGNIGVAAMAAHAGSIFVAGGNIVSRIDEIREPVILLPGGTGSRIFAPQAFDWSQPNGRGGTYEHTYDIDEEIWINPFQIATFRDDYFDVLRLESDGRTQSTEVHAVPPGIKLEARDIVGPVYYFLLADLTNAGYQLGVDLFIRPYDWRLDAASSIALLDSTVLQALAAANGTSDQSQWTITKVDLVTHSLGGSVAREYMRDPLHAARVDQLIAIAPAFLGAPKFTRLLLFGDPLLPCGSNNGNGNFCALNAAEVKDIAQNMPGLFEVAPSSGYWEFYDGSAGNPVAFQEDHDFDGDGQVSGALSYNAYKNMLFRLDRDANLDWDGTGKDINQTVFNISESFHGPLDFSWDSGIPVPEIDIIAGTGHCTIGQIQPTYRIKLNIPIVGPKQFDRIVNLNYINGDKTVPLFSATLYDPDRDIDHRGGANVYYVEKGSSDHATMPITGPVRQMVVNLLTGNPGLPSGIISEAQVEEGCEADIINVESPVELHVTNAAGNHTGLTSLPDIEGPVIEQSIPNSQYYETEETKSVVLPDDGVYTISLKATGSGSFNLNLQSYESDGTVQSTLYLRAPLTTTTLGEMTYDTTSSEPPLLYLDHDADGTFDETIAATSVLSPAESADLQPPQIEITSPIQGQQSTGNTLVAWQVTDDLSGVLNEWAYIDMDTPNVLEVTNGSVVTLPVGQHTLTVLAEDRNGNAAQEVIAFTITPPHTPTNTPTFTPTFTPTNTPTSTPTATPTQSNDLIFADGFESGDFSAWTSSSTDGGDLSVSTTAALTGNQGMQALIDDTNAIFVTDDSPNAEPRYRARFYFDPNSLTMADGNAHIIFRGYSGTSTAVLQVEFRFSSGAYQIRASMVNDGSTWKNTSWFTISDASHAIELDWRAATSASVHDGGLTLWIDGTQQAALTSWDNDTRRIDHVWLGALADLDAGTGGTYYLDALESRRSSYIGP